jgi:exosome complex component RRP43
MTDEFRIIQPKEYYKNFLENDIRPDDRNLWKFRPTTVNIGSISTANGSALVKLGNTSVVCGIKAELCNPKPDEPKNGFVVPNIELPPLCSPRFRPGPPSEQAQSSSQLLANIISNSGCILPQDLCVVPDKLAWVLYCDVICLEYDGNIMDASVIALMAALNNASLPKVTIEDETEEISIDANTRLPLQVYNTPVSSTFAVFDNDILIADPTAEEESLATGIFSVVTLDNERICQVYKPGGSKMADEQINQCFAEAQKRHNTIQHLIHETVSVLDR